MSELLQRGNRSQGQKRWDQNKTSLDNSVHLVGCGSQPRRAPVMLSRVFRGPPVVRRPLLWLCTAIGINLGISPSLLGFPWLDSGDRTEKAMPINQALQLAAPSAWPLHLLTAQAITPTMG